MSEFKVIIETRINPTEDLAKVMKAIVNLFTPSSTELLAKDRKNIFFAKIEEREGLMKFYSILRQEKILNAARRALTRGTAGKEIAFCLNKQAAYMKHISFCEPDGESPLGPIRIRIETDNPRNLINWLTRE